MFWSLAPSCLGPLYAPLVRPRGILARVLRGARARCGVSSLPPSALKGTFVGGVFRSAGGRSTGAPVAFCAHPAGLSLRLGWSLTAP